MADSINRKARFASVIAATSIAVGCGTNYGYSAWGPAMAQRLQFTATQANLIGSAGNIGQYAMGVPAGILIDSRGPRIGIILGAICLFAGYFPIYRAYLAGEGSSSVGFLSFCSFLTGAGSCTAFSAAIKTATYNWPNNRGSATAYPLSGFGLSAFFFTVISNTVFGDSTSGYLLFLAVGATLLNVLALPFIRLIPSATIQVGHSALLPQEDEDAMSRVTGVDLSKLRPRSSSVSRMRPDEEDADETSSLVSADGFVTAAHDPTHANDLTGVKVLQTLRFWQRFIMLFLLGGVGLMTINNIGNDAHALWRVYDPTAPPSLIAGREHMHVAILSLASFFGRLLSGIFSDLLVLRLHASRFWCLTASSLIFIAAQTFALTVVNPNFLFLVSSFTGLGYGVLFGVMPAMVADAFGVSGMSLNWGFMIFAPVVSANVFNLWYGSVLDAKTRAGGGDVAGGECSLGIECYRSAYWLTLVSSVACVFLSLWGARSDHLRAKGRV